MSPARMERHIERWIVVEDRGLDQTNRPFEATQLDPKMPELVVKPEREHAMGAGTNRLGAQQRVRDGRV